MFQFFRKPGLTKRDLILISFLLISLLSGLILRFSGWKNQRSFDYSGVDASFEKNLNSVYDKYELSLEEQKKADKLRSISDSLLDENEKNTTLKTGEIPQKKININLALSADLQLLPGIGQVTAERIIEYRESNNGFRTIEELMNVKGIGTKKFEKLKNLVSVN